MAKTKDNGRFTDALQAVEDERPIDAVKAQAAIDADRERRCREYLEIVRREGDRLQCELVGVAEIVGNKVATAVRVVPRQ